VSDFGKLYDPFADTLTQISYFLCFVVDGVLPPLLFLLVLYREFAILFVRNLMLRKGTVMAAQFAGKVKTVTYILAIGCALLASTISRLFPESPFFRIAAAAASVVFVISVLVSIYSFLVYVSVYRKK
jgi:CDP-diacylglycerol--glycerol-3-phosphate 3-phosphatidyltransferase